MKVPTAEQMIAKRVKGGANEDQSRALLTHLIASHDGYNLASALYYNGFAGEKGAHAFAGIAL